MTIKHVATLMLALAGLMPAALAQTSDDARLGGLERRLDALEHRPPATTVAQAATTSERIDALERRLDALEKRLGAVPQPAQSQPTAAAPVVAQPGATTAVQLPSGTVQQVPQATASNAAPAAPVVAPALQATYRSLGLRKGLTEAEVVKLLGPPVKIRRGVVDVYFYSATNIEPNVNFQYGTVIGWHD
jgi:hypothetical protein